MPGAQLAQLRVAPGEPARLAERNWVKAYATASIVCDVLERLDPKLPEAPPAKT
jgi:hypothetical protein